MPRIIITASAHNAIRRAAQGAFHSEGKQLGNGSWNVRLGEDTIARVESHALPGESFSDTIVRVLGTMKGSN